MTSTHGAASAASAIDRTAALDAIQSLRHACAADFSADNKGAVMEARCNAFYDAYEAVRKLPTTAPPSTAPAVPGDDRDDVLFAFHRYVANPTPFEVTWWTRHFPQFAQDIREHAVEVIDMNARVETVGDPADDETSAAALEAWRQLRPCPAGERDSLCSFPACNCAVQRLAYPAPTPSPESTLSPAQVATGDGGGGRRWQGCDPDEPYDPLKCAIWAALVPFQNELLATGGVTFMGLRNSIVEAVRSFAIASQRDATTPASAGEGDLRALASRLVDEINDLINESGGVWGLHLNGDDATWADITVGGRFERLPSLHDLREVLAAPAASTEEGLRKALGRIANPILHMQREVPEGHQFDGQTARSLVTVEYLQSIARDTLAHPCKSVQAIAAPAGDGAEEKRYPYSEPKAWPYWACPDCNCKNFGAVDEQKPDKSFGPGPLIRCVNCKAVFDTRPQAPTEVNSQDSTSAYLTKRRDHWLNEAQRLALLVRSLGGDPDAHGEI